MPDQLMPPPLIERIAQRFKILGEPIRLHLLNHLQVHGAMTVQELVAATGQRQANVSKHLCLMAREGLLSRTKKGLHVYYEIQDCSIETLCSMVCGRLREEVLQEQAWMQET